MIRGDTANFHPLTVHCRTGSLENCTHFIIIMTVVHCRTGSLESKIRKIILTSRVHCRTGSLETSQKQPEPAGKSSLPNRQLRKIE